MGRLIAIAGNMGAGKTSLVRFLVERYGVHPVYEPFEDNPYLDDFYEDMPRWALQSQLFFLAKKFRLHLDLKDHQGTVVLDRTIYEDAEIFATNLHRLKTMNDRDYTTYMELYEAMRAALPPPDLLIYLRCDTRGIRRRIRKRGRASEQDIPTRYIRSLNRLYEDWVERYDLSPVMIWNSGRQDYLTNLVDQLEFQDALRSFLNKDEAKG